MNPGQYTTSVAVSSAGGVVEHLVGAAHGLDEYTCADDGSVGGGGFEDGLHHDSKRKRESSNDTKNIKQFENIHVVGRAPLYVGFGTGRDL